MRSKSKLCILSASPIKSCLASLGAAVPKWPLLHWSKEHFYLSLHWPLGPRWSPQTYSNYLEALEESEALPPLKLGQGTMNTPESHLWSERCGILSEGGALVHLLQALEEAGSFLLKMEQGETKLCLLEMTSLFGHCEVMCLTGTRCQHMSLIQHVWCCWDPFPPQDCPQLGPSPAPIWPCSWLTGNSRGSVGLCHLHTCCLLTDVTWWHIPQNSRALAAPVARD